MPNTRSKRAPWIPYNPGLILTIRKIVNGQELKSQILRLRQDVEVLDRGGQKI